MAATKGSDAIGPTAHYTGRVWSRNGLSHPALDTLEGRVMHAALEPSMLASRLLGGPTLEQMLLARHTEIDARLAAAIDAGRVGQVLEVATGLSPRGWRFTERYADLLYVEADLPAMAARKRRALDRIGRPARHRVADLDALAPDGPGSLAAVAAAELDPGRGLAIVTEGLLSYLPRAAVLDLWRSIAETIAAFPDGVYLSDLHVGEDAPGLLARAFTAGLSTFVRGRVAVHFSSEADAVETLLGAGFASAAVDPVGPFVRIVEARSRAG
jgi:O-methyltransferase involved in polyketide biosynthesis